jgi:hypothetical protein
MDTWTLIHDAVFAVIPPLEVRVTPLGALCVLLITAGLVLEAVSWRRAR